MWATITGIGHIHRMMEIFFCLGEGGEEGWGGGKARWGGLRGEGGLAHDLTLSSCLPHSLLTWVCLLLLTKSSDVISYRY